MMIGVQQALHGAQVKREREMRKRFDASSGKADLTGRCCMDGEEFRADLAGTTWSKWTAAWVCNIIQIGATIRDSAQEFSAGRV